MNKPNPDTKYGFCSCLTCRRVLAARRYPGAWFVKLEILSQPHFRTWWELMGSFLLDRHAPWLALAAINYHECPDKYPRRITLPEQHNEASTRE